MEGLSDIQRLFLLWLAIVVSFVVISLFYNRKR